MRVNNALSADEVEAGWVLTCQAVPMSREVVVDYDQLTRPSGAIGQSSGHSEARNASVRLRDSMRASRSGPSARTRTARSVTPASRKRAQAIDDGRLVSRREDVADVGGVPVLEQPLVVRRVLGMPEHAVRPFARGVDLVLGAEGDGDSGDDPRSRPARPRPS